MHKSQRLVSLLVSLLALFSLTGCSGGEIARSAADSQTNGRDDISFAQPEYGRQIHQIGTEGGTDMSVSSDSGYYELVPIFPDSYSILYTDYAADQQVYLCSSPGCDHAGEYCTSYVDASKGNVPGFLFSDGKLYVVSPASASDDFLPRIEVMDESGANRRLLAEFKASQNLNAGWFLADKNNFYFVMEEVNSDGGFSKALCALNKQTGEFETIMALDQNQWILDGQGSCIFLKTIQGVSTHKVSALNVDDTSQIIEVDSWQQNQRAGGMINGKMYYYDTSNDSFVEKDYAGDKTRTVSNSMGVGFNNVYLGNVFDGKLIFTAVTNRSEEEKQVSNFYVDFAADTAAEIGVMQQNADRPVNIRSLYVDQIYAVFDYAPKKYFF